MTASVPSNLEAAASSSADRENVKTISTVLAGYLLLKNGDFPLSCELLLGVGSICA